MGMMKLPAFLVSHCPVFARQIGINRKHARIPNLSGPEILTNRYERASRFMPANALACCEAANFGPGL